MKSFDLNSYGVQEMSVQEMKKVGGGEIQIIKFGWDIDGKWQGFYLFGWRIF